MIIRSMLYPRNLIKDMLKLSININTWTSKYIYILIILRPISTILLVHSMALSVDSVNQNHWQLIPVDGLFTGFQQWASQIPAQLLRHL